MESSLTHRKTSGRAHITLVIAMTILETLAWSQNVSLPKPFASENDEQSCCARTDLNFLCYCGSVAARHPPWAAQNFW
jgi:hypothetical protein